MAAELYTPAAGSSSHDDPGSAAAFAEVGSFAEHGFDVTALRIQSALRQSLVQAVRISEQGITLDMPSTSKHSAISMLAAQAQALCRTDAKAFEEMLQDCVRTTAAQLLPSLLQPGAGAQRDANGFTVTHSVAASADCTTDSAWRRIQCTVDTVMELHAFLSDVFGAQELPAVPAALGKLWLCNDHATGTVHHWLHAAIAALSMEDFEQDGAAAAALKHVAAVRAAFLAGSPGSSAPDPLLPAPDSTAPPSAITAAAASSALYTQVHSAFLRPPESSGLGTATAGSLPSLPAAAAAQRPAERAAEEKAHEVKAQQHLASLGGSSTGGSWLEPIQGPSMLCRPGTVRSAAARSACDALHMACDLLQRWRGDEQAAQIMSQCMMQLPLVAKGGCLSRAAGGDAQACLAAVSDLAHVAYTSTVCAGQATNAWESVPTACSETLARAAGVLDELRGSMRVQVQQAVLLLARELRAAVASTGEDDTPERAVQRGLMCLSVSQKYISVCLQETPRVAVFAHLLQCLLGCVWDTLGTELEQETPASKRAVQTSIEQWCTQHAPGVSFSQVVRCGPKDVSL